MAHLKPVEAPVSLTIPNNMNARRSSSVQMTAKLAALRGENFGNEICSKPKDADEEKKKNKPTVRFMKKSGKCNIRQDAAEIRKRYLRDLFTTLVDMSWKNNLIFYISTYLCTWSLLGFVWYCIAWIRGDLIEPPEMISANITNTSLSTSAHPFYSRTNCVDNVYSYTTAFLFYLETETSLGYGKRAITDRCPEAVILFVIQALLTGILDAFMVGCIFIKISQPKNRAETLVFSKHCVLALRDGNYCLMFRVGNLRNSLIVQSRIRAKHVQSRTTKEGEFIGLHQVDINVGFDTGADNLFLVTPLIICHEINEKSPFYSMSAEKLRKEPFEIIAILEGTIESTGMICQARTSYLNDEILWGHRFVSIVSDGPGHFDVDHSEFHSTYEVSMPGVSTEEYENTKHQQNGGHTSPPCLNNGLSLRKDLLNRQQLHKNTAITVDEISGRKFVPDSQSFKINSSARRTLSDANVAAAKSPEEQRVLINSDSVQRRNNTSRDDVTESR
ncbi:G protein-activated inward rectifier potassium channel 3-like [Clavelina lepadiformis]|uniref:G protein-activated inward rectifier potassium channel 3-like n=1 Tax=Clavelina lepadiformis TaxID=159417 RepID=UPI004041BAB5